MGCDIHLHTELRVDGRWAARGERGTDPCYGDWVHYRERPPLDEGRCYDLFGILADVRNYNCEDKLTGQDGLVPIAYPKGLPKDVSDIVRFEFDEEEGGEHSTSWFTLRELIEYDWNRVAVKHFQMGLVDFYRWQKFWPGDLPKSYARAMFPAGGGVYLSHEEGLLKAKEIEQFYPYPQVRPTDEIKERLESFSHIVVNARTEQPYHKLCPEWWANNMPILCSLSAGRTIDDVRIVFWFDN